MTSPIRHIEYEADRQELSIWFGPEARRYVYAGVSEAMYLALLNAPSRGAFFNRHIRDRFECQPADISEKLLRRWQAIRSAS